MPDSFSGATSAAQPSEPGSQRQTAADGTENVEGDADNDIEDDDDDSALDGPMQFSNEELRYGFCMSVVRGSQISRCSPEIVSQDASWSSGLIPEHPEQPAYCAKGIACGSKFT